MANAQMRLAAALLLFLNFCMYAIVLGIGAWAVNRAIDYGFIIGPELKLPAHFSPIFFPMGNFATGFFVTFTMLAGVVGVASAIAGINHIRSWNANSFPSAASIAGVAWTFTVLAMGFAATQLLYIAAIHGSA